MDKKTLKAVKATLTIKECVNHIARYEAMRQEAKDAPEYWDIEEIEDGVKFYRRCISVLSKERYTGTALVKDHGSAPRSSVCPIESAYVTLYIKDYGLIRYYGGKAENYVDGKTYTIKGIVNKLDKTIAYVKTL